MVSLRIKSGATLVVMSVFLMRNVLFLYMGLMSMGGGDLVGLCCYFLSILGYFVKFNIFVVAFSFSDARCMALRYFRLCSDFLFILWYMMILL